MSPPNLFTISAPTAIGRFRLIATELGLRHVCWPKSDPPATLDLLAVSKAPPATARFLQATAAQLADYFLGSKVRFSAPLDLTLLTPFARRVLKTIARLPYGQTISYGQLAKRAGSPNAARAVGSCLARNPLPIIIPCHRVLTCTASLGGFSAPAGPPLKQRLLSLENIKF